jgi:hypothetical protein
MQRRSGYRSIVSASRLLRNGLSDEKLLVYDNIIAYPPRRFDAESETNSAIMAARTVTDF